MKKQIFLRQKQLKSQKSLDYNTKSNNISLIDNEKNNHTENFIILEEQNKKLEKTNNDLIFEIEKKNIYFNKIYALLKYILNNYKNINISDIMNFVKKQKLEILFDNNEITNNNNILLYEILFTTNKDILLNDLENYKNKYNDVKKQLNFITNTKYINKENQNDNNQIIIEYQKKINELYISNENLIK